MIIILYFDLVFPGALGRFHFSKTGDFFAIFARKKGLQYILPMKNRAAAIIIRDKKLLVIHRHKPERDYYILPGGGVEFDETFEEACIRELKEETGFDALSVQLVRKYITLEKEEEYFLARVPPGEPVLGGAEAERQRPENHYAFEWVDAEQLKTINLQPESARRICIEVSSKF